MPPILVAVEANGEGVSEFWRVGNKVKERFVPFRPFIVVPKPKEGSFLGDFAHSEHLEGDGYNRLISFDNWRNFYNARKLIKDRNDAIAYASPAKNFLSLQDYRMFEGAKFDDVVRLAVDIETTGLEPTEDQLLMVTYYSNRGHKGAITGDEKSILRGFVRLVDDIDPDIIEGHNLYGFDLPFLSIRSELLSVKLSLGRNGSVLRLGNERSMMIGPNEKTFTPAYIYGRHIVDTYIQVQKYDVTAQRLSSYGLKEVAKALNVASEDRVYLDRSKMEELYQSDPEQVIKYAIQDVEENLRIGNVILPVEFFQTQILPDGYGGVVLTGNGERVNSLLVSEYLRRGKAIPFRQQREDYIGGYVEVRGQGLFERIVKADVESLYPSLMIQRSIRPASDTENVMLPALERFKAERLEAKYKAKEIERKIEEIERSKQRELV